MKRFLCGILALLAVFICAACSAAMQTSDEPAGQSTAAPAPQDAERAGSGPVSVNEAYADRDTVAVRPAPSAAPGEADQTPTPATGEVPVVPLVGAMGLILICAAGLVLLRRF